MVFIYQLNSGRELNEGIGYKRATSKKPSSPVHKVIEQIEALDLQSFEA
jgi:hypothetical protein